jgi:hypothetical protein
VERDLSSFVHDHLRARDLLGAYDDNQPRGVRCVHPIVTLIEKLDAVQRRFPREDREPADFVRHYEDAARIIDAGALPPLEGYDSVRALADEMVQQRQIAELPAASGPAFSPDGGARWAAIDRAHAEIGPMYWGARVELRRACEIFRAWMNEALGLAD